MDSNSTTITTRSCFTDEDDGLVSVVDMEAGFSGNAHHHLYGPVISRPICYGNALHRRGSYRNLSISSRFSRFYDEEQIQPHFLDACFLCKKSLGGNKDIFMYRGDIPFCSEDCRQEQIDLDEAKEKKNWNLSSSSRKSLRKGQRKSTSPNKDQGDYPFRTGAVAA